MMVVSLIREPSRLVTLEMAPAPLREERQSTMGDKSPKNTQKLKSSKQEKKAARPAPAAPASTTPKK